LLGWIRQPLTAYASIFVVACESHSLGNVGGLVRQDFDLVVVGDEYALLLKLVEVSESGEAFLTERQKLHVVQRAAPLAHQKRLLLERQLVLHVKISPSLVNSVVVGGQVTQHAPLAPFEVVKFFFGKFRVRVLQVELAQGTVAAEGSLRYAA